MAFSKAKPYFALTAVAALALFSTLRPVPSLAWRLIDQCGEEGRIQFAPVVVVGVITADTLVLPPVPERSDPTYPLQLRRLKVRVENVLRGARVPSDIDVYYFTWAAGFDGPRPFGFWHVGGRRIFGLRKDSGVLRTACDGWDSCTDSLSNGAHLNYRPGPDKSLDNALLDLRLTRGTGPVNEIGFATQLDWEPSDPGLIAYAIEKLRYLAVTEQGDVRSSACQMLRIFSLDRIDAKVRASASKALETAHCQCWMKPDRTQACR